MKKIVKSIFYGMIFILSLMINISFSNAATANNPVVVSGLTPVKYTGSAYIDTTQNDSNWYDYEHGIWANARTSNGDLYVWIPRFTYKISSDRKSVSIKWSNGKIDDTTDEYIVHPAFYFDEYFGGNDYNQSNDAISNLTGFWMKKEVAATSVSDISTDFDNSLKLKTTYNLPQSGTYTHITKASEWGAMAYLTSAKGNYNSTTRLTTSNYTGIKLDVKQEYVMGIKGTPTSSSEILSSINKKYRDRINSSLGSYHGYALSEIDNNSTVPDNSYLIRGGSLGLFEYTGTSSNSDSSKGYRTTISILPAELTDTVSFFDTEATVMEGDYLILGVDFYVDENNWKFPENPSSLFINSSNVGNKKPVDIKCVYEGDISYSTSDLNATAIKLIKKSPSGDKLEEVAASSINTSTQYSSGKYTLVVRVGGVVEKNGEDVSVFTAVNDMQTKIIVNELNLLDSSGLPFKIGNIITNKVTLNIVGKSGTTSISKVVMTRAPSKSEYALNEDLDLSGGELIIYLGNFAVSDPVSTALLTAEEGVTSTARTNYWVENLYYNNIKIEQQDKFIINVSNVRQINVTGKVNGTGDPNHQLLSGPGKYSRGNSDQTQLLLTAELLDGYIFSYWQSDSTKVKASNIHEYNTTFIVPSKTGTLDKEDVILTAVYIPPESLTIQNPKKEFIVGENFELGSNAILNATYKNSKGNTVTKQLNMGTSGVQISLTNKVNSANTSFSNLQAGEYTVTIQYASKLLNYDIEVVNPKYKLTVNKNYLTYGTVSGTIKNAKNVAINTINLSNEQGYVTEQVSFGNTVALTATPNQGYIFSKWTVSGEENLIPAGNIHNTQVSFTMPQKDIVVTAEFVRVYTVTFKVKTGQTSFGTLTGTLTQTVIEGQATTPVEAVPNSGYKFVNWVDKKGDIVSSSANLVRQYVLADEEYTAVFIKSWTVNFYSEGVLFKTIEVKDGSSGYIEEIPTKAEYVFTGWDKDLSSIKQDTDTNAIFVPRIEIREKENPSDNMVEAQIIGNMITEGTLQYIVSPSATNPDEPYTLNQIYDMASGDWVKDTSLGIFKSKNLAEGQDSSALIKIQSRNNKEVVKFDYFVSNGDTSQFGVTINGEKVISPSDNISYGAWHEFSKEVDVKDGKIEIGLSYSHGQNNSANDYAAIKGLVISPAWTIIPNNYNLSIPARGPVNYIHVKGTGSDDGVIYRKVSNVFNADIKYTVRYDANGGRNAPANQEKTHGTNLVLSSQKPTRANYIFDGWNTDIDGTETSYNPNGTYSQNSDVILYAQWSRIPVGSYISYTGGDYTGKWVVLRNNPGAVEIISKESVGNLTLVGADGYANCVKILNDKCKTYVNSTYAVSGRSVGATSESIEQIDTTQYPLTYMISSTIILPYHDEYFYSDNQLILNNTALQHTTGNVWFASRLLDTSTSSYSFNIRYSLPNGGRPSSSGSNEIYLVREDGTCKGNSFTKGVRPIVTLRPDLEIISGSGTEADPYVLGIQHESVAVGSYIDYTGGDYTGKWVVLRDTPVGLEIISKESVGSLTLSGADGYANAVKTLNDKCATYVNSTYATSGRSVGATSSSIGQINTTDNPLTFAAARNHELPYEDTYYTSDQTIIKNNANLKHSSGNVWLASRSLDTGSSRSSFGVRGLITSGSLGSSYLFHAKSDGSTNTYSNSCGVRPVITLKPNIKITGGSGTSGSPYTIGF